MPVNTSAKSPIVPDKPFGELLSFLDNPRLLDPRNHNIDFTIQRELPWKMLIEVGYVRAAWPRAVSELQPEL